MISGCTRINPDLNERKLNELTIIQWQSVTSAERPEVEQNYFGLGIICTDVSFTIRHVKNVFSWN